MPSLRIPALAESARLRYLTFGTLYFAQGIPQGLQLYAIPAWMALKGADAATIGTYVATCTLPWTFKLVAGPLMDRYGFLAMGRRRPWLLGSGLGMVLTLLALACVPDPLHHLGLFMAVSFVGNCFGATQDVATDGLAVDITPEDQQARANAVMWGAKTVGIAATLTGATWAINTHGYSTALFGVAAVLLLILVFPSLLRERPGERLLPWSLGSVSQASLDMKAADWGTILRALRKVVLMRSSLIGCAAIFLWGLAYGLKDAQWPVFTIQRLGWGNGDYANLVAGAGIVAALSAMVLAGWLADRLGKVRAIMIYLVLMALAWMALALSPGQWAHAGYIPAYIYGLQFMEVFCTVAMLATAMSLCWARVAATQFTLYMVCNNAGVAVGAFLLGPVQLQMGWSGLFLAVAVLIVLSAMAWRALGLTKHRAALEGLGQAHPVREARMIPPAVEGSVPDLGMPGEWT